MKDENKKLGPGQYVKTYKRRNKETGQIELVRKVYTKKRSSRTVQRKNVKAKENAVLESLLKQEFDDAITTGLLDKKTAEKMKMQVREYVREISGEKRVTERMVRARIERMLVDHKDGPTGAFLKQALMNTGATDKEALEALNGLLRANGIGDEINMKQLLDSYDGKYINVGGLKIKFKFKYVTSNKMVQQLFEVV